MKKIIKFFLFLLIFNSIYSYGQKTESRYRKLERVTSYQLIENNDSIKPFYISTNPITNREYITYLCWIAESCTRYPEILLNAFPGLRAAYIDSFMNKGYQCDQFKTLVNSNFLAHDYVFNPEYIDFPVIGINWVQAMDFFSWFSDRYNESILLQKGYFLFQTNQDVSVNFNTEAYLGEYFFPCLRKPFIDQVTFKERPIKWDDRILFPSFRLPSKYELELVNNFTYKLFIPYKSDRFLEYWIKQYITLSKNILTLSFGNHFSVNFEYPMEKVSQISSSNFFELYLDYKLSENDPDIIKIFSNYKQPVMSTILGVKFDSIKYLGRMPFILISEDSESNPIYIQRNAELNDFNELINLMETPTIFRFALSAVQK